jgi:hypothetical protein
MMAVHERSKGFRQGLGAGLAALVMGAVGAAAAAVWLRDGGTNPAVLAGVLLPLAVAAGPVYGLRLYSRSRMQTMLDRFADTQLAQEQERRAKRLSERGRRASTGKDSVRSARSA